MKLSAIMVRLPFPLRMLSGIELEVLSRILFEYFQGLSPEHAARWKRIWRRLYHRGGNLSFFPVVERSGKFHARHMAIEDRIFEHQDNFPPNRAGKNAFREWLKTGAVFGHWEASAGQLVFVPDSLKYEDCSDDEMREFHQAAIDFLRTPYAVHTLWPAMSEAHAFETIESLLENPADE